MAKETDGLSEAMRREKDARVYKKIMALVFVLEDDTGVPEATKIRCSENSVRNRLARFSEDGIDGLRDLPCSGCRPEADRERTAATTDLSIERNSTDVTTVRDDIRDATWTGHGTGHVGSCGRCAWGQVGTRSVASYSEASQKTAGGCSGRLRDRSRWRSSYNAWRRCAKSGRAAVFCDRWSVHRSAAVAEYLAGHPDARLTMIPRGSPYLNVVEECGGLGRHVAFRGDGAQKGQQAAARHI